MTVCLAPLTGRKYLLPQPRVIHGSPNPSPSMNKNILTVLDTHMTSDKAAFQNSLITNCLSQAPSVVFLQKQCYKWWVFQASSSKSCLLCGWLCYYPSIQLTSQGVILCAWLHACLIPHLDHWWCVYGSYSWRQCANILETPASLMRNLLFSLLSKNIPTNIYQRTTMCLSLCLLLEIKNSEWDSPCLGERRGRYRCNSWEGWLLLGKQALEVVIALLKLISHNATPKKTS